MSYDNILKTNNPDKKIEHFWLTFKDSIKNSIDEKDKEELDSISSILNKLQLEKKYDMIEQYIRDHIIKIGFKMIANDNYYKLGHLIKNLSRWDSIIDEFLNVEYAIKMYPQKLCNYNILFYCLLRIYYSHRLKILDSKSDNKNNFRFQLIDNIKLFAKENNIIYLDNIFNIAIENNIFGIIDKLKKFVDVKKFIKPNIKLTDKFIEMSKGNKLHKKLNPINL